MYSNREIRKDAKRYAKAKMNYGKGAGIERRHINAELEKKMHDESYKQAFDAELEKLDMESIVRDVKIRKGSQSVAINGKKVLKTVAGAGALAASGYTFYVNNKEPIDRVLNGIKVKVKNVFNKRKYKKQIEPASKDDIEKANAYLKSIGVDYIYQVK